MEFRRGNFAPKCTVQSKTRDTFAGINFFTNSHLAFSPKLLVLTRTKMVQAAVGLAGSLGFAAVLGTCFLLSKGQFSQRKQRVKAQALFFLNV